MSYCVKLVIRNFAVCLNELIVILIARSSFDWHRTVTMNRA